MDQPIWHTSQRECVYSHGYNMPIPHLFFIELHSCMLSLCVLSQLCPTLCNPMDCSPTGSSVHGISQARILEWVAISFSRGSSWPRDQTQVPCLSGRLFTIWATREALCILWKLLSPYNVPGPGNPNVSKIDQLLTSWRFLVKQGLANYDPRPNLAHSLFVSEDLLEHNHVHLFMLVYGYIMLQWQS